MGNGPQPVRLAPSVPAACQQGLFSQHQGTPWPPQCHSPTLSQAHTTEPPPSLECRGKWATTDPTGPPAPVDGVEAARRLCAHRQEDGVGGDAVAVHGGGGLQVVHKQQAQLGDDVDEPVLVADLWAPGFRA